MFSLLLLSFLHCFLQSFRSASSVLPALLLLYGCKFRLALVVAVTLRLAVPLLSGCCFWLSFLVCVAVLWLLLSSICFLVAGAVLHADLSPSGCSLSICFLVADAVLLAVLVAVLLPNGC